MGETAEQGRRNQNGQVEKRKIQLSKVQARNQRKGKKREWQLFVSSFHQTPFQCNF